MVYNSIHVAIVSLSTISLFQRKATYVETNKMVIIYVYEVAVKVKSAQSIDIVLSSCQSCQVVKNNDTMSN